jgi:PhoH-like ATPase
MAPITDCIEFIVNSKGKKKKSKQNNEQQGWQNILGQYSEKIRLEAMCYARGLSLHNVIILIDEAQNLSPSDMKTLLSRSGQNSKIFLTGDPGQVDVKGLDSTSNGLSRVSEIFKANSIAASLILTKGERSMLATEAARLM